MPTSCYEYLGNGVPIKFLESDEVLSVLFALFWYGRGDIEDLNISSMCPSLLN